MAGPLHPKTATDNFLQLRDRDELRDGQFAYRNYQAWPQDFDLAIEPGVAVCNLLLIGHAIGPARRFARKTTADRGEINFPAHYFFRQARCFLKPAKERLACRPGK